MSGKRETYQVTLTRPEGVSVADMKSYIEDAVSAWCRGGHPDDPLWEVADHQVVVTKPKKEKTA